jgi:hypothetical protein
MLFTYIKTLPLSLKYIQFLFVNYVSTKLEKNILKAQPQLLGGRQEDSLEISQAKLAGNPM